MMPKKMYFLSVALFLVNSLPLTAQNGTLQESLVVESEILDRDVSYSIYLPEGYDVTNRHYPVLYLLHGFSDDDTGWVQFGEVENIAGREIQTEEVTPMIIVMPDAGVSWYINNHDGSVNFEDFFIEELIPHIDETYRTRAEKQFRAIAGLSMGGYGSLIMATKYPHLFAAAAPLSAGVSTDEEIISMPQGQWDYVYRVPFGRGLAGRERLTDHYRQNSILDIVGTANADSLKSVRYYIDCGDDDFLIRGNMALYKKLIDREIPAEFRVRKGAHNWSYWRSALPQVLKFVSESFHR